MVNNIKAVNVFEANKGNIDIENCDYIEYVAAVCALPYLIFFSLTGIALCPISPLVNSGPSSPVY